MCRHLPTFATLPGPQFREDTLNGPFEGLVAIRQSVAAVAEHVPDCAIPVFGYVRLRDACRPQVQNGPFDLFPEGATARRRRGRRCPAHDADKGPGRKA